MVKTLRAIFQMFADSIIVVVGLLIFASIWENIWDKVRREQQQRQVALIEQAITDRFTALGIDSTWQTFRSEGVRLREASLDELLRGDNFREVPIKTARKK